MSMWGSRLLVALLQAHSWRWSATLKKMIGSASIAASGKLWTHASSICDTRICPLSVWTKAYHFCCNWHQLFEFETWNSSAEIAGHHQPRFILSIWSLLGSGFQVWRPSLQRVCFDLLQEVLKRNCATAPCDQGWSIHHGQRSTESQGGKGGPGEVHPTVWLRKSD